MSRYAVFGVGQIGKVHAEIVRSQGCDVVALGDEEPAAVETACNELSLPHVATFNSAEAMARAMADEARFLLDEFPTEVWASLHSTVAYDSPVDEGGDTAFVTMRYASGVVGRLDLSRTHGSGYNNETYVIGTEGTLHVGRFAGYPGPIPVEAWTAKGQLHPASQTFDMTVPSGNYAEYRAMCTSAGLLD
jgi:predicted dehydrogenase